MHIPFGRKISKFIRSNSLAKRPPAFRLRAIEVLEDRLTPASTFTWTGANGDGNWGTGGNWLLGVAPQTGEANPTLIFDSANTAASAYASTNDVSGITDAIIQITDTFAPSDFSFTLTNGMTLATGGTSISSNVSSGTGATFAGGVLTMNGPTTFSSVQGLLTINDNIANGGFTLTVDGTGDAAFGGIISGGGGLQKSGVGILTISGANTFSGGLAIKNGTVIANVSNVGATSGAAGPSTNAITLGDTSGSNSASLLANSFTVSNPIVLGLTSGTLTIGTNGGATAPTFSGGVTGTNNLVFNENSSGNLTIATGSVNNAGTITNIGSGTGTTTITAVVGASVTGLTQNSATANLALNTANTLSSPVAISNGVLVVGAVGALGSGATTVNPSGELRVTLGNGLVSPSSIVLAGGTIRGFNAATITYGGNVTVTADSAVINERSGAASATSMTMTFGTLSIGTNQLSISSTNNQTGGTSGVTFTGTTLTGNPTFNVANNAAATNTTALTLGALGGITSARLVTKSNTGALTLGGLVTLAADLTLTNTGTGLVTANAGITGTGNLAINNNSTGSTTISTVAINIAGSITNSGNTAATSTTTSTTTISAAITAPVTGVVQNGAGTLILSGNNTFSTGVTLTSGVLQLSGATSTSLGTGTLNINGNATLASTGTSTVNTNANPITLAGDIIFPGGPVFGSGTGSLDLSSSTITLSGAHSITSNVTGLLTLGNIVGATAGDTLTKLGTGPLTLVGNASNTGGQYTFSGGTVNLNKSGGANAIGANGVNVAGGTVKLVGAGQQINDTATLTVSGGIFDLNGFNETVGNLTSTGGTLQATTSGTLTIAGAGVATVGGTSGTATVSAPVVLGSGGLTISPNGGNVTFSGAITSAGAATNITLSNAGAGTVTVGGGSVNNQGTITNNGGGAGNVTISGVIGTNVTGVVQNSSTSSLTLSGANTFTGGLTIKNGSVIASVSNVSTTSGAAGPSTVPITLGDSSGSNNASLLANAFTVSNPINLGASNGTFTLGNNGGSTAAVFSGAVALNGKNLTIAPTGTGSATVSGGITGTGNVVISNGGTTATTTISTTSINNIGTITNNGGGNGTATISALIGSNVTSVTENSATSNLTLGAQANLFGALNVTLGTVTGGANGGTFGTGTITLGSANTANNATLNITSSQTYANPIVTATNSTGTLTLGGAAGNPSWTSGITLNTSNLVVAYTGSSIATFSGGVTGTGNITISNNGTVAAGTTNTTFSTTAINNVGTITNNSTGNGAVVLSAAIGANVTKITQNSATLNLTLSGANGSFTGNVDVLTGTLTLGGATALTAANLLSVGAGGTFNMNGNPVGIAGLSNVSGSGGTFSNSGAANTLTLTGSGTYTYSGVFSATSVSNLSILKIGSGLQSLTGSNSFAGTVTVNSGTLTTSTFTHTAGQVANSIVNGTNLGQDSLSVVPRLIFTGTPTLIGTTPALSTGDGTDGNGAGAAKDTQIIPFLVGESTATAGGHGTNTGVANTFVTYNATTGVRPLNPTDEFDNWTGSVSPITGTNVRVFGAATTGTGATINSLIVAVTSASALSITDGTTLTLTSGALLFANTATIKPSLTTGTLSFGSGEGFITVNSGLTGTISAPVTTSGGAITGAGAGALVISGPLTTTGNLTLTGTSSGAFTASGGIVSSGAANLILNAASTGVLTLGGGSINNAGSITNSGTGSATNVISGVIGSNVTGLNQNSPTSALNLTGSANTFTGPISVAAGATLQFSADGSLGNAANIVSLGAGATFRPSNTLIVNHSVALNGGAISSPTSVTLNIAGNVSGAGALTGSAGTTILSGNNSHGGITQTFGSFIFSSDRNLGGTATPIIFAGNGTSVAITGTEFTSFGSHPVTWGNGNNGGLSFNVVDPANTFNLSINNNMGYNSQTASTMTKQGQGTLRITVPQTASNSGVTYSIQGGVFKLDAAAGGTLSSGQKIGFGGGGTLYILGKSDASFTQNLGQLGNNTNVGVNTGGGNIVVDNNASVGATATTLGLGNLTFLMANNGSSLNISTTNLGAGSAIVNSASVNDATGIISGRIAFNPSGAAAGFAYNVTNVANAAIGAYSPGSTLPASGATSTTNYLRTDSGSVTSSETVNTLTIGTTTTGQSLAITGGQTLTINAGGLLFNGGADYSITGGSLNSNTATNSDLIIHQYGAGTLTIGSAIVPGIGTTTLTKAGPGTLVLTNTANTYTGTTFINGGVLSIDAITELGSGNVTFGGGTLRVTDNISTNRTLTMGGSGGTIDIANGKSLTLTTAIAGSGLILNNSDGGNGTLTVAGPGGGNVSINGGILKLSATGFAAQGATTVSFGSATTEKLQLNGNSPNIGGLSSASANAIVENTHASTASTLNVFNGFNNTFAGTLQDGAAAALSLVKGAGATLLLTGNNTYTGATTVLNGVLQIGNGSTTGTLGSGAVTANATLTFNRSDTLNLANTFSGSGIINQSGGSASLVNLTGNSSSFTGVTNVNSGKLTVNNTAGAYGNASSSIVVASGATLGGGDATATSGFIGGAVTVNGTLAPGNSIGTLSIANSVVLAGVSSFEVTGGASAADQVTNITTLTYGGTLAVAGSGFVNGDSWDLFNFTSQSGNFTNNSVFGTAGDGTNLPTLTGGLVWQFNYATGVLSVAQSLAAPTVASIVPAIGPTTGGTMVIITGSNFVSITSVTFGGTPATITGGVGTTQINVTTAAHVAGLVEVVVSNPAGSGSLAGSSDFTYAAPAVSSVVVNGGPSVVLGGSSWSLAGQNSVVKQILVTFNQAVTVASDAFTVTPVPRNDAGGPGVVAVNGGAAPSSNAATTSVTMLTASTYLVTFVNDSGDPTPSTHGGGILNSGVYDLTTIASKVSANGETLASNQVSTFFAMFGTINANDSLTAGTIGDGFSNAFVDPGSLFQFSDAFGSNAATPTGPPAYNIVFDSNLDGFIDPGDLFAFSDAFGIDWDF